MAVVTDEEEIKTIIREQLLNLAHDLEFRDKFNQLQKLMYDIAKLKGWHSPSKTFGEQVVMMHSELSEVIEAYRTVDGDATRVWLGLEGKPEGVPIEFADLTIREMDTCKLYKINLFDAIIEKAIFNLTRPHRHGDKKL
jgi:hypothetical protein